MAGDVRIEIQDDERVLAAIQHEVLFVVLFLARNAAKDTVVRL